MTDPATYRPARMVPASRSSDSLADILERVLDKGIVVAGDIQVKLLDIELLTLKVRLLIASVDTARDMGIDWWAHDPFLTGVERRDDKELEARLDRLERAVSPEQLTAGESAQPGRMRGIEDAKPESVQEIEKAKPDRRPRNE